jgi:hypothetical protein
MGETIRERIARILEPQAWRALGAGDTLAYRSRRTSSQRKADAILNILSERAEKMADHEGWTEAGRSAVRAFLSDGGR